MTTFRVKYVKAYTDRHGKRRYYYRRPGFPSMALAGEPGSREFAEALKAAEDQAPRERGAERTKPFSFNALIAIYLAGKDYAQLKPVTRRTYLNDLKRFRAQYGDMDARAIERRHVSKMLDDLGGKSEKGLRRQLSILLTLAQERGWRTDQPMNGLRRKRAAYTGFRQWASEDVATYEARWPEGTRERLALYLLLCTAQRRGDVVRMGRQHVRGQSIRVVQSKTGTPLDLPIHPRLATELAQVPADQLAFLLTQYGKPFSPAGFTRWFVERAQMAGCPKGCTPHGLRKAALAFLAEAGCSAKQLMAVSGHKNIAEVTMYTEAADQARLADAAVSRLEWGTKSSNPLDPVRQKAQ